MKFPTINMLILSLSAALFFSILGNAQEARLNLLSDPKFDNLLNEKRRINSSITVDDRYKIQIFTGDNENSRKSLAEFKRNFPAYDATIVFNTPSYKVWIGNFKTRIEAERNLEEIRKTYKNAFMIKPNK
jgi:hypothetical protein